MFRTLAPVILGALALIACSSSESSSSNIASGDAASSAIGDTGTAGQDVSTSSPEDTSTSTQPTDTSTNTEPPITPRPRVKMLPDSCFLGPSPCDPRNGEGCDTGEACDFATQGGLVCFPPPNTAGLGEPCNNQSGPYCASGGWCHNTSAGAPGVCRKVCCADAECPEAGTECVSVLTQATYGSLGICRTPDDDPGDDGGDGGDDPPPACLPFGQPCTPANDLCCGFCHVNHCH